MSYFCHDCGTVIEEDEDTLCHRCKAKTYITPEPSVDVVEKTILSIVEPLTWNKNPYSSEEARDRIMAIITAEVERRVSGYREALEMVMLCSVNPAHTMTKIGLEECLDACNKVAIQALAKGQNVVVPSPRIESPHS